MNGCSSLEEIDLTNFNMESVTTMYKMFSGCSSLEEIDLSDALGGSVTTMYEMFSDCSNLKEINISNLNMSKVTSNNYNALGGTSTPKLTTVIADNVKFNNNSIKLFSYYSSAGTGPAKLSVTTISLRSASVGTATSMQGMFHRMSNLTSVDLTNFDTTGVTDMSYVFGSCSKLTSLNVSSFDTSAVTNMSYMFYDCSELSALNLSNFDTRKVTTMYRMFYNCSSIVSLDLSNFRGDSLTTTEDMFNECTGLTEINLTGFNMDKVTTMENMFDSCSSLNTLDLSSIMGGSVTNIGDMFRLCNSLKTLNISNFDMSKVTKIHTGAAYGSAKLFGGTSIETIIANNTKYSSTSINMYKENTSVISISLRNSSVGTATSMQGMFYGLTNLTSVDLTNFDTTGVTDMSYMFYGCNSLTNLKVTSFDTSKVTTMQEMFSMCKSLTSLNVSNFDTSNVTNMWSIFYECSSLTSLNLSNFDTRNVTNMQSMFNRCSSLTSLNISSFDTSKVTTMKYMFYLASSLTTIDVSSFDTRNVTDMYYMFNSCTSLTTIFAVNDFDRTRNPSSAYMFTGDDNLVGGAGTAYETPCYGNTKDKTYAQIANASHPGYFTNSNSPIYTITFDPNGGIVSPTSKNVVQGYTINGIPTPTAPTGYTFIGWYTATSGGMEVTNTYVPISNMTIYARYYKDMSNAVVTPETMSMGVGESKNISVTSVEEEFTFTSSNEGIATVNSSGKVTGVAVGTTTVTVTGVSSGYTKTVTVTVLPNSYTITLNPNGGSISQSSMTVNRGSAMGTIPTPTPPTGEEFIGWYSSLSGGIRITSSYVPTSNMEIFARYETPTSPVSCTNNTETVEDGIVCRRATSLHTEKCTQSGQAGYYCDSDGYTASGSKGTTTITYGSCGTDGVLSTGDAFTCDVNGDGTFDETNERFYYVSDYYNTSTKQFDNTKAVLIYYSNTVAGYTADEGEAYDDTVDATQVLTNYNGPVSAVGHLPSSSDWNNVSLVRNNRQILTEDGTTSINGVTLPVFSYSGKTSRLLTYQELESGCYDGSHYMTTNGGLSTCNFLFERTKYSKESHPTEGPWLETPFSSTSYSAYNVYGSYRGLDNNYVDTHLIYGVRPVIEVSKNEISYGASTSNNSTNSTSRGIPTPVEPVSYTITFDSNGGSGSMEAQEVNGTEDITITKNTFTKEGYEFIGWNTKEDGTGDAYIDEGTIPINKYSEDITLYAEWRIHGWKKVEEDWEYYNHGIKIESGFHLLRDQNNVERLYYFEEGKIKTGWVKDDDDNTYYFSKENLYALTNGDYEIEEKTYRFDANGICLNPNGEVLASLSRLIKKKNTKPLGVYSLRKYFIGIEY